MRRRSFRIDGQPGFILPGVVMFIFVLTIIGLSLFALSSYEAQFMYRSLDEAQAFYDASSGIDHARFLLGATKVLSSVTGGMLGGADSVVYASAQQGNDSTGSVQWGTNVPVILRVEASYNGKHRELQATFDATNQPYDNLFSLSSTNRGLFNSKALGVAPNMHVWFTGHVWQTYSGTCGPCGPNQYDWNENIYPTFNDNTFQVDLGPVPPPQVPTYYAAHIAGALDPTWTPGGHQVTLAAGATPTFFKTVAAPGNNWSLYYNSGNTLQINVSGVAIWMFDSGFYSDRCINVNGTGNDMLVLIVKKTNDAAPEFIYGATDIGCFFKGALNSPSVPVIIVTDGYVAFDNDPSGPANTSQSVNWLSIYANLAFVHGPDPTGLYSYSHVENAQPAAELNLQNLLDQTLLPNATSQRRKLSFIPGTWQELGTN